MMKAMYQKGEAAVSQLLRFEEYQKRERAEGNDFSVFYSA